MEAAGMATTTHAIRLAAANSTAVAIGIKRLGRDHLKTGTTHEKNEYRNALRSTFDNASN